MDKNKVVVLCAMLKNALDEYEAEHELSFDQEQMFFQLHKLLNEFAKMNQ